MRFVLSQVKKEIQSHSRAMFCCSKATLDHKAINYGISIIEGLANCGLRKTETHTLESFAILLVSEALNQRGPNFLQKQPNLVR